MEFGIGLLFVELKDGFAGTADAEENEVGVAVAVEIDIGCVVFVNEVVGGGRTVVEVFRKIRFVAKLMRIYKL
jgi:hypothetical protein